MDIYKLIIAVILCFCIVIFYFVYSKSIKNNKEIEFRFQELEKKIANSCYECGVILTVEKTKTIECYNYIHLKKNYCKRCAPPYDIEDYMSYYKKIEVDEKGNFLQAHKKIK